MTYLVNQPVDAVALFSGGLDSILAARLVMEQGKKVRCLHFYSPFFGKKQVGAWEKEYGLHIEAVDVSDDFAQMLAAPGHGFGSVINPCVDCKILMMTKARAYVEQWGAKILISGEVLGQRPMSQRRETLNVIRRDADVKDILVRPLCAKCLDPSPAELAGHIDREGLLGISGRGRKEQLDLAARFGIKRIPTPGGGCMLTEHENARRYWPVLQYMQPTGQDFYLANVGRQMWNGPYWLSIGRNEADNKALQERFAPPERANDILFKVIGFPGPLAVGRAVEAWTPEAVQKAAALVATYSPKAWATGADVTVRLTQGGESSEIVVQPTRDNPFMELRWENVREQLHALRKQGAQHEAAS